LGTDEDLNQVEEYLEFFSEMENDNDEEINKKYVYWIKA